MRAALAARALTAHGLVQGVGYRWSAAEAAKRLKLVGWVRNTDSYSVEMIVEGPLPSVDAFIAWARRGPPGARVDALDVRELETTNAFVRFTIEP